MSTDIANQSTSHCWPMLPSPQYEIRSSDEWFSLVSESGHDYISPLRERGREKDQREGGREGE